MGVESMRWMGDRLELLDQRKLPDEIAYVSCRTAAETATAIRDMVVRGAPAIGCAAAFGMALDSMHGVDLGAAHEVLAVELRNGGNGRVVDVRHEPRRGVEVGVGRFVLAAEGASGKGRRRGVGVHGVVR